MIKVTNGILIRDHLHMGEHLAVQATKANVFDTVQVQETFRWIRHTELLTIHIMLAQGTHTVDNIGIDLVKNELIIVKAWGQRAGRSGILVAAMVSVLLSLSELERYLAPQLRWRFVFSVAFHAGTCHILIQSVILNHVN